MVKAIALDIESTIFNKGNVYDYRNKCCYIGLYNGDTYDLFDIEYSDHSYKRELSEVQSILDSYDTLVGFNIKFDLGYLRRYRIDFSNHSIHDCQLVDFILGCQSTPYPSLDGVASKYNLGVKLNMVANDYWDKGIDTIDVPKDILEKYLCQDLFLTWEIYLKQLEEIGQ